MLHRLERRASLEGVAGAAYRHQIRPGDWDVRNNGLRPSIQSRDRGLDALPWPLRALWPEDEVYKHNPVGHLNWQTKWIDGASVALARSASEVTLFQLGDGQALADSMNALLVDSFQDVVLLIDFVPDSIFSGEEDGSLLERGEEPWLDPYAAEDPAELFAVCAEMFFDVPKELRTEYPEVYEQLKRYFKQDPAGAA